MAEAYPLHWPDGWERTKYRQYAAFKTTFAKARDGLFNELRLMGADHVVLSTNIPLRNDGLPYSPNGLNSEQRRMQLDDPGVSVYFRYDNNPMCFACDSWFKIDDNVQSIKKTIEALRGIERWSASDMMQRAFSGFQALPNMTGDSWWHVLEVEKDDIHEVVRYCYHKLRSEHHTDTGGDADQFHRIQQAWKQYNEERANG